MSKGQHSCSWYFSTVEMNVTGHWLSSGTTTGKTTAMMQLPEASVINTTGTSRLHGVKTLSEHNICLKVSKKYIFGMNLA